MVGLCDLCAGFRIENLRYGKYDWHPSLVALRRSQEKGCPLCVFLWRILLLSHKPEEIQQIIDAGDKKISLDGDFEGCDFENLFIPVGVAISGDSVANGWSLNGYASIFATNDNVRDVAAATGRAISQYANSPENLTLMKSWISACDHEHARCGNVKDKLLPTQVIDVGCGDGSKQPRLYNSANDRGKYVALSYCWGHTEQLRTMRASLEEHQRRIDLAALSLTVRQAVELTRNLGLRYLWVDALCIIQDSAGDWERESSVMGQVYSNAYLTLMAGGSSDTREGLFPARAPPAVPPYCFEYRRLASSEVGRVFGGVPASRGLGILTSRAWTFQEDVLSNRSLAFGEQQLFFRCKSGDFYEDGLRSIVQVARDEVDPGPRFFVTPEEVATEAEVQENLIRKWYWMVEEQYSLRSLTKWQDKLPALSGVASVVQHSLRSKYVAGLWEHDIIRGLLWGRGRSLHPATYQSMVKPPGYRAPSWSWAALDGAVNFKWGGVMLPWDDYSKSYKLSLIATVVRVEATTVGLNPLGEVKDGFLCVRAPIKRAKVLPTLQPVRPPHIPILEMHPLVPFNGVEDGPVVAEASFDVEGDRSETVWCTQLVQQQGLVLKCIVDKEPRAFRRIGFFNLCDLTWFDMQVHEDIRII